MSCIVNCAHVSEPCSTLLVDVNPVRAAVASAAANPILVSLEAGALSALDTNNFRLGTGRAFIMLPCLTLLYLCMLLVA